VPGKLVARAKSLFSEIEKKVSDISSRGIEVGRDAQEKVLKLSKSSR
jgi:hypothetical protein